MASKQQTIKYSVSCTGVGLHTGVESTITFHPAEENTGIKFIRNDMGDKVVTPDIDNVVDLTRGTTIEENGVRVHTTEHVMSACAGMRVNNLIIELNSKEPPVMDGSSRDFVAALKEGNIIEQKSDVDFLEITKPVVWLLDKIVAIAIRPLGNKLQVGNDSALGMTELLAVVQASKEEGLIESFEHELLSSALDLGQKPVSSIMVPSSEMVTVSRKMNLSAIEEVVLTSGHSRLPVIGNAKNDLLGFLHVKDFIRLPEQAQNEPVPLEMIRRMLIVVPELPLDDLLLQMRRSRSHVAGVKNTAGEILGLVALEDVIEELVGDIEDESDLASNLN